MSHHFHLVVETPSPNLVEGMKWFLGGLHPRFNLRHKLFGHLFSGRYKALVVDDSASGYLKTVCDYVHLNPVRAGLLAAEQPLAAYRWSSYPLYVSDSAGRPDWLRGDRLLGEWGLRWDQPGAGRQFALLMEARRKAEQDQEFQPVRRGWRLGSEPFRAEMLSYIEVHRGKSANGITERSCGNRLRQRPSRLLPRHWGAKMWGKSNFAVGEKGIASSSGWPCGSETKLQFPSNGLPGA